MLWYQIIPAYICIVNKICIKTLLLLPILKKEIYQWSKKLALFAD